VHERQVIRSDLYVADEVFMCGTAAEVTPVRSVDDHEIGPPGTVTKAIQAAFFDAVRGRDERWTRWLEYAEKTPATPGP
jgi:branched-chain amino acid aminotransferase